MELSIDQQFAFAYLLNHLPSYSHYILAISGPLKHMVSLLRQRRLGFNHIDKLDFLKAYPAAHRMGFTAHDIQSGFAAAGTEPFEPHWALDKLNYSRSLRSLPLAIGML